MAPRATVQIPDPVGLLLRGDLVCFLPEQDRLAQDQQRQFSIAGLQVWMPEQEVYAGDYALQAPYQICIGRRV
jgi:hypothetical protein